MAKNVIFCKHPAPPLKFPGGRKTQPLLQGRARLLGVNEIQVQLRAQEAGVGVLLHQAINPPLGKIKAAPADVLQVLFGVFPGVGVQIDLEQDGQTLVTVRLPLIRKGDIRGTEEQIK